MLSDFLPCLSKNLLNLLQDADDYNVSIQVGENEDIKEFRAHSNILRARSPYFKIALSSDWVKKENGIIVFIKPNISPTVFEIILRYIYAGILDLDRFIGEDILDLLMGSKEYGRESEYDDYQSEQSEQSEPENQQQQQQQQQEQEQEQEQHQHHHHHQKQRHQKNCSINSTSSVSSSDASDASATSLSSSPTSNIPTTNILTTKWNEKNFKALKQNGENFHKIKLSRVNIPVAAIYEHQSSGLNFGGGDLNMDNHIVSCQKKMQSYEYSILDNDAYSAEEFEVFSTSMNYV
ncbi:unnamed protein product [Rhizophagus irregularis]|uniref:BTB domain-containing protein n=1 Tax=Rhizophagus irregularis TaxID=588596 RepID=A0A916E722_9GLOM|nr:unnamed protein product [Rhizophagus irregularis]